MAFLGSLISGGLSLLGGLMGQENQSSINAQNIAQQDFMASNGIQMRVADAKSAGINPLAALGYSAPSAAVSVGSNDLGKGVADAGQSLSRAIQSTATPDDRAYTVQKQALDLQHGELENQLLASQIRTVNQPGNGPPTPALRQTYGVDGQGATAVPGSSGAVSVVPDKTTAAGAGGPSSTGGVHPEIQYNPTAPGYYMPQPSKDAQGASFGSDNAAFMWDLRNYYFPIADMNMHPPFAAGPRKVWRFNPWYGYHQVDQGPDVSGYPYYPTGN